MNTWGHNLDKGMALDFDRLILYPYICEKVRDEIGGTVISELLENSKISSAYRNNLCSLA